jgi:predicted nucleotidyltransferase
VARKFTILSRVHLENRIADMLGMKVDLAHVAMLRDGIRERAIREAVLVF